MPSATPYAKVHRSQVQLLRVLGTGFGLAVIVGNTIGGGIFRTPGTVAGHLPNIWLYFGVWIAGGLYAFLGANSVAELGAMIPQSGGQYVFARHALGEYAGFIVGWSDWISTCGSAAAVSMVVGEFLVALLPGEKTPKLGLLIAAGVSTLFVILQWRSIGWGSTTQNLTSLIKALLFLCLIGASFLVGGGGSLVHREAANISLNRSLIVAIMLSLQSVIYTYDGWTGVIYFSEEVENPGRDIPRAMFGGVLSVFFLYMLVNVALLYLLPISEIAGKDFAAGVAATAIFGRYGDTVFRLITVFSLLSTINACHLMASRVLFAMSRDGLFTRKATTVNAGGTPSFSLFLCATVTLLFVFFGQTFEKVISVMAFFFVAVYTISFVSVFVLRRREPNTLRPFKSWGYPWTNAIALIGSVLFLAGAVASDPPSGFYAGLLLLLSYPVFRLIKKSRRGEGELNLP